MKELLERLTKADQAKDRKFRDTVEEIEKMTSRNDHGGALMVAAKLVGAKKEAKVIEHLNAIRDLEGGMSSDLIKYRADLFDRVKAVAKRELDQRQFNLLMDAF